MIKEKLSLKAGGLKGFGTGTASMVMPSARSIEVEQAPPLNAEEQAYYDTLRDKPNEYFAAKLKGAQDMDEGRTLHPKLQYHLEHFGRVTEAGTTKAWIQNEELLPQVQADVDRTWQGRTMDVTEPVGIEDRLIDGPGGQVEIRIYTPKEAKEGPLPILVYYHGGGWVLGSIKAVDRTVRLISTEADVIVVSVNYRLLPNSQFPVGQDDGLAAFRWARDNAEMLGGIASNVAVGGDSAGGYMSAAVSLMARDTKELGPSLQLLYYPVLDMIIDAKKYPSIGLFRDGFGLTEEFTKCVVDAYFPDEEARYSAYVSPIRAGSHEGLPPAIIATANFDLLRDQGETYARKLEAANVPVTYLNFDGLIHGFTQHTRAVDEAREAALKIAQLFGQQVRMPRN